MYKPVAQPNLWFQGGNLALSRFFSKFVALQIKARMEGIETPVYGKMPPSRNDLSDATAAVFKQMRRIADLDSVHPQ